MENISHLSPLDYSHSQIYPLILIMQLKNCEKYKKNELFNIKKSPSNWGPKPQVKTKDFPSQLSLHLRYNTSLQMNTYITKTNPN